MTLTNKWIAEGMRVTNGKQVWKVIYWNDKYTDTLLQEIDRNGKPTDDYVIAEYYELYGTDKEPQISWMNGKYFDANTTDEAYDVFVGWLVGDKKKSIKERSEENEIIVSELQDTVEYFCGLFEEIGELKGNALKDLKNAVERLEVFNAIGSIYQWGVEVLNKCGIKYKGIKESKKSIKEEINRPTWSKWVVNNVHHIEYFFNGKIVDKKMLNSLFESEGFDTDVDTVEDEIKKAVRSVRLGNLDGNALHIAHNSVGNRIDLVFDIGGLLGGVESLSNDECVIRINGDIYEQDEPWNFGFAIYLTCDVYPLDFSLAESKKKSLRKSLKESAKPINEKNVAKFVDELNKWVDKTINYADENSIDFTKKYGKLYSFDYVVESDGTIRVYDEEGTLDWWDGGRVVEFIKNRANGYGWYAEACSGDSDFCFGEL